MNMRRLPLLISSALPFTKGYLGPTPCDPNHEPLPFQPSPHGYSSYSHLLFDLTSLSTKFRSGQQVNDARLTFRICPGAVIDLDDSTLPLSFIPIRLPRVTIQCGERGARGTSPSTKCTIRGGGKRSPKKNEWNTNLASSYKDGGHAILGGGNLAQIYVYGEDAYEVTLRGLTMDNSVSRAEVEMYGAFVQEFGADALWGDSDDFLTGSVDESGGNGGSTGMTSASAEKETTGTGSATTDDYGYGPVINTTGESSLSASVTSGTGADEGAEQMLEESTDSPPVSYSTKEDQNGKKRNLQAYDAFDTFDTANTITIDKVQAMDNIEPAHRYASIAVRGGGFGDDPGPRIITIEDCEFIAHRGYAVLVSPGIELPEIPVTPKVEMPEQPISGAPHNYGNTGYNMNQNGNRKLNLLDGPDKFISQQGSIKYFDTSVGVNYLDGRRVKIVDSEFIKNNAIGDQVAGLVTSAYSITMTKCKFSGNSAKSMVYVYNNQALIDNTLFAQNTVQAATVVLKSPEGSAPKGADESPDHLVERSCFIGSKVGMSNVLVTDIINTGFGQRDNHATGTEFSWDSKCEGAAAEELGEDCLETGECDGTCVIFDSEKCLAENLDESNQQDFGGMFMWNASVQNAWSLSLKALVTGAALLLWI
ncbi:hypothetical protein ACHAXN_003157 [Cyclotella atomus]